MTLVVDVSDKAGVGRRAFGADEESSHQAVVGRRCAARLTSSF